VRGASRRIDRHGHLGPTLSDRALAKIVAARAAAAGLEGDFAGAFAEAPGLRRRPRGPAARRPRSCATGAGRACRWPAATSVGAPAGAIMAAADLGL
jgi:hypothetical protein